ncbi:hypothetical protein F183_A28580 [Bryobacterales bacterium F-183]|nr:hypothetical protein F183_A28580 [Bryobacterales bacterium F-183]
MVHLLLCADSLQLEGLISSPFGPGRAAHILEVIGHYEKDYPALRSHSRRYPAPNLLRSITKEGALESPGPAGVGPATEGSRWIVQCAKRNDPRPLHVLVWGGIEDLAQALHDAPEILPKLRVYFIGGPNKLWSVDAYNYVEQNHPRLWMIEANSTYRGWFVGGEQQGTWGNQSFVEQRLAGRGALGTYFATHLKGVIKMGDSPSVGWLLHGHPENPAQPGWGGRFERIWDGRKSSFNRLTTIADCVEVFGVVEIALPAPAGLTANHRLRVMLDNRVPTAVQFDGQVIRFRFAPRDAKPWSYRIESDFAPLNGVSGQFTAVPPPPERYRVASTIHPNWWCDDQDPARAEGIHPGAKSVNQWRTEFLEDFARRAARCVPRGRKP